MSFFPENFSLWPFGRFRKPLQITNGGAFYQNSILSSKAPVLVDLDNLLAVYEACPLLQMVLSKKAEMLANGKLELRKKSTGEEIEKHPMLTLMESPNPLQNRREFIYEWSLYFDIYANAFVYQNRPFPTRPPKTLFNLPAGYMKINPTGKWLDQTELNGIIESYELYGIGTEWNRKFTTEEVTHINSGLSRSPVKSNSKFIALQLPISNSIAAYKTRNCLIYENAGTSVISSGSKSDSDGALPVSEPEKKKLHEQFVKNYGLADDQMRKIITTTPVNITPLIFPVQQMQLFEEVEDDFNSICGTYGVDRDIFPSVKGATFENKKNGELATYNGTIKSTALTFCQFLNTILLQNEDAEFYMDYSELPIMQSDKVDEGKAKYYMAQAGEKLYVNGIIDKEEFADMCEVEGNGDGVIKTPAPTTAAPVNTND